MDELYNLAMRFKLLYRISPGNWLLIMLAFLVAWTVLMLLLQPRCRMTHSLNVVLMLLGLGIIFMVTFVRRGSANRMAFFVPLRPLFGIRTPRDYWQVTIMNLLVYVPFACGLPFFLAERIRRPVRTSILICFILSILAEVIQYAFGSGTCEVDDVLVNTLGAVLGTLPYMVVEWFKRRKKGNN